jgi:hypothetical protein
MVHRKVAVLLFNPPTVRRLSLRLGVRKENLPSLVPCYVAALPRQAD